MTEQDVDKRIAAAFRRFKPLWNDGLSHGECMEKIADELDPPAKQEVRLNPCGKCGSKVHHFADDMWGCSEAPRKCGNGDRWPCRAAWNAANPVKPPCCDKCGKPLD